MFFSLSQFFYQRGDFLPFSKKKKKKKKKKKAFLVKFDIKNGFSDSFPFQKCHSFYKKVTTCNIFHNFWVDTILKQNIIRLPTGLLSTKICVINPSKSDEETHGGDRHFSIEVIDHANVAIPGGALNFGLRAMCHQKDPTFFRSLSPKDPYFNRLSLNDPPIFRKFRLRRIVEKFLAIMALKAPISLKDPLFLCALSLKDPLFWRNLSPKDLYIWGAWWHSYVTFICECPPGVAMRKCCGLFDHGSRQETVIQSIYGLWWRNTSILVIAMGYSVNNAL